MKTSALSQISIITGPEGEEPVAALLERIYGVSAITYTDFERGHSVVSVYRPGGPAPLRAREAEVRDGLGELTDMGLDVGRGELHIQRVRREDWTESWKKHFKDIQVGSWLLVKPSWSKRRPKAGQAVVVLDPGLSFGTGQHATTSFCLRELVRLAGDRPGRAGRPPTSMLDIGSGSGILAIAAAKLGFAPVEAFDFDPVAVRVAAKNTQANGVRHKVALARKDLSRLPLRPRRKFDVICANLISTLLIAERERILARLAPGGTIILAGILAAEFGTVRRAYEERGLKLIRARIEREWQSGSFQAGRE